ncbi:hypothetical protein Q427_10240 [Halomonas sp. BC04]|nr:hypothetical protein Q427_10240 [Halomonas sp. BC04]
MNQHLITFPILLPMVGALALLLMGKASFTTHRRISVSVTAALVVVSLLLLSRAASGELTFYSLGNWQAPFGIVLMLDRLSA